MNKFIEPYGNYKVELLNKYNNNVWSRHERTFKYKLSRLYFNSHISMRTRDWTLGHISVRINTMTKVNNENYKELI